MISNLARNYTLIRNLIICLSGRRTDDIIASITPFLKKKEKIVDIGAGLCVVGKRLKKMGYNLKALDIKDMSIYPDIKPIIYDGLNLPFENNKFDTALLITVLHHTRDPKRLIMKVKRITQKIIIMEDIFANDRQKRLTHLMDSVTNFDFSKHPHTNKSDREWKRLFKDLDLKLIDTHYHSFWRFFTSATYVVTK